MRSWQEIQVLLEQRRRFFLADTECIADICNHYAKLSLELALRFCGRDYSL